MARRKAEMTDKMTDEIKTAHSPMFEKIRGYFRRGLWNEIRIKNAVIKEKISTDEFFEITGKTFSYII